jgi:excisionase family DNA binding protein
MTTRACQFRLPTFRDGKPLAPDRSVCLPKREWIRISEIADYLDVSARTVDAWIEDGSLAAFRKSGTRRISKRDFLRFLRTNRTAPDRARRSRDAGERLRTEIFKRLPVRIDPRERKALANAIYRGIQSELSSADEEV